MPELTTWVELCRLRQQTIKTKETNKKNISSPRTLGEDACDASPCPVNDAAQTARREAASAKRPANKRTQQSNCTVIGGQVNCRTAPTGVDTSIHDRPPSYVTGDVNQLRRQSAFNACMEAKGYRRN